MDSFEQEYNKAHNWTKEDSLKWNKWLKECNWVTEEERDQWSHHITQEELKKQS